MLKRPGRNVGLGILLFSVLALDFLLGLFTLLGLETMIAGPGYRTLADATFDFPWSHGLAASLGWSAIAFVLFAGWTSHHTGRASLAPALVVVAVFSHFLLDAIVHVPELPLLGPGSTKFGLGLWKQPVLELMLEMSLLTAGLCIYLRTVRLPTARLVALLTVLAIVATLTITGLLIPMPAPKPTVAAASWLATPAVLTTLGFWVERDSAPAPGAPPSVSS